MIDHMKDLYVTLHGLAECGGTPLESVGFIDKAMSESLNVLTIAGHHAEIAYDPYLDAFRGSFVGLNGGADFYATSVEGLKAEGAISLRVYLEGCKENGLPVYRQ